MGRAGFPTKGCDRARQWASLRLDGELSEFEEALLDAHLEHCDECGSFASDTASIAAQLRATPRETLTHPVTLPSRRHGFLRPLRVSAAAAAVVAVAGLAALVGSFRGQSSLPTRAPHARGGTDFSLNAGLRELRRSQLTPAPAIPNVRTRDLV